MILHHTVARVEGFVQLVAGQTVGERGDRRRSHRHTDDHVAGSGLARHQAAHERTRGERHQQRRDAHGEARDGVVLGVVGRARSDLVGAALEVAPLCLHRPEVEGDGNDGEVRGHTGNLPPRLGRVRR